MAGINCPTGAWASAPVLERGDATIPWETPRSHNNTNKSKTYSRGTVPATKQLLHAKPPSPSLKTKGMAHLAQFSLRRCRRTVMTMLLAALPVAKKLVDTNRLSERSCTDPRSFTARILTQLQEAVRRRLGGALTTGLQSLALSLGLPPPGSGFRRKVFGVGLPGRGFQLESRCFLGAAGQPCTEQKRRPKHKS